MYRKFKLANEQYESNNDSVIECKNNILKTLNELINLNLEDLSIKFKIDQSTSTESTSNSKVYFNQFPIIFEYNIFELISN